MKSVFANIEEIISLAKQGKMFILVDDDNRENEGDLVVPAELVTKEQINFMITHGRGLVCISIEKTIADRFGLKYQDRSNVSESYTAFATSVDARVGITTGVSVSDRYKTIKLFTDPNYSKTDICTPGHIFPIIEHEGGLLARQGHTEASVAISSLAGFLKVAVICEVIKEDGEMARREDLEEFALKHDLKIGFIKDLVAFVAGS